MKDVSRKIGFGGGCHWCTEAVFQSIVGVSKVEQGFINSDPPDDMFSEAVLIRYNPLEIDISILLEIHLRTHASTSEHKMRGKYRSAIYILDDENEADVQNILEDLQHYFDKPLVTQILRFMSFKPSDERFQNYYVRGPERPFCKNYIDPKLSMLRRDYSKYYQLS